MRGLRQCVALVALLVAVTVAAGAQTGDQGQNLEAQASALNNRGDYAAAIPLREKVLELRESALGADHVETALAASRLATSYVDAGRLSDAEALYKRTRPEPGGGSSDALVFWRNHKSPAVILGFVPRIQLSDCSAGCCTMGGRDKPDHDTGHQLNES